MASSRELQKLIDDLTQVQSKLIATGKTTAEFDKAVASVKTTLSTLASGGSTQGLENFGQGVSTILQMFKGLNMELKTTSALLGNVFRSESLRAGLKVSGSTSRFSAIQDRNFALRTPDPLAGIREGLRTADDGGSTPTRGVTAETLQNLLGSAQAVDKLEGVVRKLGFTFEDMKTPIQDVGSGITEFSLVGADGIKRVRLQMTRLNKITRVSVGRFKTLGNRIATNIAEVTKWTIAISVVYAPLRLLNQLIEDMISNQTLLANITIALGTAQRSVNTIFEDSLVAANAVGESITGVLEGYTQAVRATGAITNETQRFLVVNQLLVDSLVLSKLSTLSQAVAMDTLVAALRQTNTPLDEGVALLDSWVATTKIANVDLATLATSFSITATAAKNAGLEFNELNGLIAVMAENTGLSATEVGNAVRAMVSGLDTDIAQKTLREFGIEITDLEGNLFGFMNTFRQIAGMQQGGLLSDDALNRIAIAIGGGVRRGPQIVAELLNLSRVEDINALTVDATGDAYDALDVQLETVESSLKRVGNEFQNLAQTLGTDGGLLDTFSTILEVVKLITGAITGLVGVLGSAGPVLAAVGIAGKLGYGGGLGGGAFGGVGFGGSSQTLGSIITDGDGRKLARGFGTIAPVLFMAGINASRGNWVDAGANVAGGIAGALIAGPIGAIVGAGMAEQFVNTFFTFESDLQGLFSRILIDSAQETKAEEEGTTVGGLSAESELFKIAGFGSEPLGRFASTCGGLAIQMTQLLNKQEITSRENATLMAAIVAASRRPGQGERVDEIVRGQFADAAASQAALGTGSSLQTGFITEAGGILESNRGALEKFVGQRRDELKEGLITGELDLTIKAFVDQLDSLNRLGSNASTIVTALGQSFRDIGPDITSIGDAVVETADIFIDATETERSIVLKLTNQIAVSRNIMEEATTSTEAYDAAMKALTVDTADLVTVLNALRQNQLQEDFSIPNLLNLGDLSQDEVQQVLEKAKEITRNYLNALTPDEAQQQAIIDTWSALLLQIGEQFSPLEESLPSFAINAAKSALGFGGAGGNVFDVRSLNLDSSRRGELNTSYQFIDQLFKENFPAYEDDVQSLGVIWKDNVTDILHVDNLKLQLAMQQLVDINEKQLEGIYNLPTDSSFYVPFTGYRLGQSGGGGGIPLTSPVGEGGIFGTSGEPSSGLAGVISKMAAFGLAIGQQVVGGSLSKTNLNEGVDFDPLNYADRAAIQGGGTISDLLYRTPFVDTEVKEIPIVELKLIITATFQSLLDGQVIANQVKTLVTDDMIRADGRSGGLTKSYVM